MLVEHPLHAAIEQRRVRQIGHWTIKPQMNSGDRRVLKRTDVEIQLRRYRVDAFEGQGANIEIAAHFLLTGDDSAHGTVFDHDARHWRAQSQFDIADAFPGFASVEPAERYGRHAHLVRVFAREKTQPKHLETVSGRHAIEFL